MSEFKQLAPQNRPAVRRHSRLVLSLVVLCVACASTAPPLEPQYEALVDRSRNLEGLLDRDGTITGKKLAPDGQTTFKAFFKPEGLVIVHATTQYENGNSRNTFAYYDKGQPFYAVARTNDQFQGTFMLQVFFDATGKLIHSRSQKDGALAPMPEGQPQKLVRRTADLASDAAQARGPGHKIGFDLGAFNDLGLIGPPLRSVAYGYCIPANDADASEVTAIDRTAKVDRSGAGPCKAGQWYATGNTGQPGFRKVLLKLAGLAFVSEIKTVASP